MSNYLTYVLVPADVPDVEGRVTELLAPYYAELELGQYRAECECVWHSAVEKAKELPEWSIQGPSFTFTKEQFSAPGFELGWRRKVLELGSNDPDCDDCGGSGIVVTKSNPASKWDGWQIGAGFTDGVLRDCLKEAVEDPNIVPIKAIDLERIPEPDHIVTPQGQWISAKDFIWSFNAVVIDESWKETAKRVLEEYSDATLVVVNLHS